ncbi:hypothetical protein EJB05_35311 [Eragrostis curvula]|uniref:Uncharacterized protein n=1 Tax=Eragrostis curvula TaxID=38414 RepID=A0A5J9U6I7_9POAL|nr:hypothetical protein EJB05_35311 [Eragrostis curvula]
MDRIEPTMSRLAAISCVTSTGNQPWVMANYLMCNHDRKRVDVQNCPCIGLDSLYYRVIRMSS